VRQPRCRGDWIATDQLEVDPTLPDLGDRGTRRLRDAGRLQPSVVGHASLEDLVCNRTMKRRIGHMLCSAVAVIALTTSQAAAQGSPPTGGTATPKHAGSSSASNAALTAAAARRTAEAQRAAAQALLLQQLLDKIDAMRTEVHDVKDSTGLDRVLEADLPPAAILIGAALAFWGVTKQNKSAREISSREQGTRQPSSAGRRRWRSCRGMSAPASRQLSR
jgi:hypothetical protein